MSPLPNSLTAEQRRQLLLFARQIIAAAVCQAPAPQVPASLATVTGCGAFVSLHLQGRLRGCIGMVESNLPLPETIARCARAAALEDQRFQPLRAEELPKVSLEISLLSPLETIAPDQVIPGVHGLLIRRGYFSGLLLPQVAAKYKWPRERFLEETCVKAGLPRQAWRQPDATILGFTAEVFSE
jgi:AmmeMemoRadiSam system protein A